MKNKILHSLLLFVFFVIQGTLYSQTDNPCGATVLPIGAGCAFQVGSLPAASTGTAGIPAPGCANYPAGGDDVWYQVTVPASGTLTVDLNTQGAGPTDMGMAFYSAASCAGPFTLIECDDDDSNNGLMPMIQATGLTPGATIWIRLWEFGGDASGNFNICATSPAPPTPCTGGANNACATADPFCTGTAYNYCNSTGVPSMGTYDCLFSTPNPMWMYLNIQTSGNIDILIEQFTTAGVPIDVDFALYGPFANLGTACASITGTSPTVDCSFSIAATETANIPGAVAGQWYMMLITNFNGSAGYIEFSQTGGGGATNCNIVAGCTVSTTQTNVTCNGGNNGTATATINSGTGPFTYNWVPAPGGGQGTATATGLTAQAYTVTVTSAGGNCTSTATITQPPVLNGSTTQVNVLCNGGTTGSTTVTASGGVAPYNISWSGTTTGNPAGNEIAASGGTYTLNGLGAGTYNITITDANGCTRVVPAVVITQPTALVGGNTPTHVTCAGGTNGNINVTATGGTAPYNVSWAGTASGNPAGNEIAASGGNYNIPTLSAGNYTVTIVDANGCQSVQNITINPGVTINANITPVASQCLTGNSFNFSGSTSTITSGAITTYTWNFGDGTPNGSGVNVAHVYATAGTFTVTLTASNGPCSNQETFNVNVFANPTVTVTPTNPLCNGGTGSITANGVGGVGPYNYAWAAPLSTTGATVNNVPVGGPYTVTVTTSQGCTVTGTASITQPPLLAATISGTNVACNGGANGTATVVPSGGTGAYTYNWTPAPGGGQGTATATGLTAQTYTVTITDANGCSITRTFTPTQPTVLTASISGTNVTCNGGANGTATVVPAGGPGGNTFIWAPAPGGGQGTATATGLTAQTYTVTVTSTGGCTTTASFTPTQPTALTATISGTNVSCNGGANGTATVVPAGGPGGNTFVWAPAPGGGQGTATATGLTAQTYTVTITSTGGCTTTASFTPTQPSALTATISGTNVLCNGGNNGTATVVPVGGPGGNTFVWAPAPGGGQGTATATGLTAQTYTVTITSTGGCTTTASFTPTQPTAIGLTPSSTNTSCGASTGTTTVVAAGGAGGYTYSWNTIPVQTTATATGLAAGGYIVTVTDGNGCMQTANVNVGNNAAPTLTEVMGAHVNVSCNGGNNGSAQVLAAGGAGGNTFVWAPAPGGGQGTATATGLTAQTYTVTVTDANGCSALVNITITQPTALTSTISGTNVTCFGGNNGTATVAPSGGVGGNTFVWAPAPGGGQGTATATGLTAQTYTVTVTNANGCITTASFTPAQPSSFTASIVGTNVSCNGGNNATATVTPVGGPGGNTFVWSPAPGGGQGTTTVTGLTAQTYTVTVTSTGGCTATATYTPTQPTLLTSSISGTNISCNGGANGTATVVPAGGPGGNTFVWAPAPGGGQGTATATGLTAQTYTVTVTSTGGCTTTSSFTPTQPTLLTSSISGTNISCNGGNNGTATVVPAGGPGGNTFVWSPAPGGGQGTATATGLTAQTYTVTVTSTGGCTTTASFTPTQPTALTASISGTNITCFGGNNGTATVVPAGGPGGNTFVWAPAPGGGQGTAAATGLTAQNYTVTITSTGGCTTTANFTPTQPANFTASVAGTNVSCNGGTNATATVTPVGGPGGNTFLWSPAPGGGQGTASVTGLSAQTYTVTVTSTGGCVATATYTPTAPTAITLAPSSTNTNCGANTGTVSVVAGGGAGGYTYSWNTIPVQTTATATGLAAGGYIVIVTDANGCTQTANVNVGNNAAPTLTEVAGSHVDVSCNGGNNGSAEVLAAGGAGGYSYSWSPAPGGGQGTAIATGLTAQTYTVTVTDANGCNALVNITITEPTVITSTISGTNVTCNGGADGTATVVPAGGAGGNTFVWAPAPGGGQGTATATGLTAQNYTVTVTTTGGCTTTASFTPTQPTALTASISGTNISCNGGSDGTATVVPAGGPGGNTFVWAPVPGGGQGTTVASGLTAQTYTVTITSTGGCTTTANFTPTEPTPLTSSITGTNITCNGNGDGTATVVPVGGPGGNTFVWAPAPGGGQGTATATGLTAQTYTVTVTSTGGCTTTANFTPTEPTLLTSSISGTNVSCNGAADGTATVVPAGGPGGNTFVWSPAPGGGQGTATATGLTAQTYTVTITSTGGCVTTSTFTPTQPTALTASISGTDITCFGGNNGTATVVPNGGPGGETFVWAPAPGGGQGTAAATGLTAQTYTVTITSLGGCNTTASFTPTQPTDLTSTISGTNISCNGGSDGTITVVPIGGPGGNTFAWAPAPGAGQGTSTITGLTAQTYTVVITSTGGCTTTTSFTPTEPTILTVATSSTNTNCGGTTGTATATPNGGTAGYTYTWNTIPVQTTATATGLAAGSYTVIVTDANGCVETENVTVGNNLAPTISEVIASHVNVSCNAGNDGSAEVLVAGGAGGNTFVWAPAPGGGQGTAIATGLTAQTYTATVTDANGCSAVVNITITEPTALSGSIASQTMVSCNGLSDGTVTISGTGGTPTLQFNIGGGNQASGFFSGLNAGSHPVTITDGNGCTLVVPVTILEPTAVVITSATGTNPLCNLSCDGTLSSVANGGTGTLVFTWGGVGIGANQSNLCDGTYSLIVTDDNGCTALANVTITDPTAVTVSTVVVDAHCGLPDGSATATASGGTGTFTYNWYSDASLTTLIGTGATLNNIVAGTYYVEAIDGNNCSVSTTAVIINIAGVSATAVVNSDATGFGLCNGSATVNPVGGVPGYTFLWDNGSTTATVNNLCAGTSCVTVTDASGCITNICVTITEPAPLDVVLNPVGLTCNGICNGSVSSLVTGGVAPYTYLWSTGAITPNITGLCAGNYSVTVTDNNGNTFVQNTVVTEPTAITITTVAVVDANCNGGCDGEGTILAAGGTGLLQYNWTGIGLGAGQTGLCAGTYPFTVFDANGCLTTGTATISEPAPLVLVTNSVNSNCGANDGSASVVANGGTIPYTYLWSSGGTAATENNLTSGPVTITVTDGKGCVISQVVNVGNNPAGSLAITVDNNVLCFGAGDGQATGTMTGGAAPFNFSWNTIPVQTTATATNLVPGTYTLTSIDDNGCILTETVIITEPTDLTVAISGTDVSCNGGSDGTASIVINGGTPNYTTLWNTGGITNSINGLISGVYNVTVTDQNGCVETASIPINEPNAYAVVITPQDANCKDACTGMAFANVSGGTAPYSFQWDDVLTQVTPTASFLCAGTYNVVVTDDHNCIINGTVTIAEPDELILSTTPVDAHCQQNDGSGCVTAIGGTAPYDFNWLSTGNTTNCQNNLFAATYLIEVTDVNGCSDTVAMQINDIAGPDAVIIAQTNVDCFGNNNGTATVNMIGGTGIFTVLWDANANSQTTPTASNLLAGLYSVTITDAAGCAAATDVTINEPEDLIFIPTTTNPTCFNFCDGITWIAQTGGTLPYTYDWRDGLNNPLNVNNDSLTNLCPGNYNLILTDGNGCVEIINYSVTQPLQIGATIATTDNTCFNSCDGTAMVTAINGIQPITFTWNDPNTQTGGLASGLCAGPITVTITDNNGCTNSFNTIINEPTLLVATINSSGDVSCSGLCDGFAGAVANGGTPPYNYSWSNGVTGSSNIDICTGTYVLTVTDANGCVAYDTVIINTPTPLVIDVTGTNNTCYQSCDGTANVAISGATPPYNIQWDNPTFSTSNAIINLCSNTYNVVVIDDNGCQITGSIFIDQPAILDFDVVETDANCLQSNGQICTNVIGGVAPYFYQWSDPNGQLTSCVFNIAAGCYSLTVTDGNGCTKDSLMCIDDIAGPDVVINSFTDVTCNGDSDGSIDLTASGGTGVLTITWLNSFGIGIPAYQNLSTNNTLPGGTYGLLVTDAAGCVAATTQFIFEPTPVFAAITSQSMPLCFGGCDGTATVSVSGGMGGYTFAWTGGATPNQAANTGFCAGTYQATATDLNGCPFTATANIFEPSQLLGFTISTVNPDCFGSCTGSIELLAFGATAPYTYTWPNGINNGALATNLCDGTYITTITDDNGCQIDLTNTLVQPTQLVSIVTDSDASCTTCNGAADLNTSGGTPPYNYQWSFGTTSSTSITGLCAGIYDITVVDGNGCSILVNSSIIDQVGPVITSMTSTPASCFGTNTGTATVNTNLGTNPLTYQWDDNLAQTTQTAINITAGPACVVVTDFNSCVATNCVVVNEPNELLPVGDLEVTICFGDSTQVWASGQGGTTPYTITWTTPGMTGAGPFMVEPPVTTDYCFSITDANGCISPNECVTITVNPQLSIDLTPNSEICFGDTLQLNAQASGGNGGPYNFIWTDENGNTYAGNNVGNNSSINVNPTVTTWYYVALDDACSIGTLDSVEVTVNPNPIMFLNVVDSAGCSPFTAQFIMNSDIGVSYTYDFECDGIIDYTGPLANATHTYPTPGLYDVCVTSTSVNGCVTSLSAPGIVEVYPLPVADFSTTPPLTTILSPTITFNDLSTGNAVTYAWDFGDGNTLVGPVGGTVPTGTNGGFTSGTYEDPIHMYTDTGVFTVTLLVTNQFGCTDQISYTVTIEGDYILFTPNAFTPNGDGTNDVFFPLGIGVSPSDYQLLIFNRWGELIFESYNPDQGWDGTHKGEKAKQDVYVWKVTAKDHKDIFHDYIGHVTLLK